MNKLLEKICSISKEQESRVACVCGEIRLTYGEMIARAKKIAQGILKENQSGHPVGIYMNRSEKVIIIMLASLFAGCAYIPIDKRVGIGRIKEMLYQAECDFVIADENCDFSKVNVKRYEELEGLEGDSFEGRDSSNEDVCYIIFTSGSTGIPKGVKIQYSNVYNLIKSLEKAVYNGDKKTFNIAVMASFSFDSSVKQIYYALSYGHTLHIISEKTKKIKRYLLNYLKDNSIFSCDITPTLIDIFAADNRIYERANLRKLLIGGEKVYGRHINNARALFGYEMTIYNVYGPTECCVDASIYEIPYYYKYKDDDDVSVGYTVLNSMIRISKEGEVIISGACVGAGYTSTVQGGFFYDGEIKSYATGDLGFIDKDNKLYVIGRRDDQVKLRGYRIELQDIEGVIRNIQGVRSAICFIINRDLACVLVSDRKEARYYKEYLKKILPDYMIPKYFVFDDEIKMTVNMKLDRKHYEKVLMKQIKNGED